MLGRLEVAEWQVEKKSRRLLLHICEVYTGGDGDEQD
jgi:hypothetical protein